jgi:hypothetical protein
MLGKFAIALYVSKSAIGSTYGAAGSFVVLLVWIYYSSIILYFGAEFTKAYAIKYGSEIHPNHYAVVVKRVEVESESGSLQQNHAELEQHKEDIRNGVTPQLTANRQQAQPQPATGDPYKVVKVKPYGLDERDEKTVRKETKKSVGMATVVGGLLLYFINTSAKKTNSV